jgi:hypothetical protein
MRIRVGCGVTYELGRAASMLAIINVHSSRVPTCSAQMAGSRTQLTTEIIFLMN